MSDFRAEKKRIIAISGCLPKVLHTVFPYVFCDMFFLTVCCVPFSLSFYRIMLNEDDYDNMTDERHSVSAAVFLY